MNDLMPLLFDIRAALGRLETRLDSLEHAFEKLQQDLNASRLLEVETNDSFRKEIADVGMYLTELLYTLTEGDK